MDHQKGKFIYHQIARHGAPFVMQSADGRSFASGKAEASRISKQSAPDEGLIDLISCYSANGGPFSNAQMVANETGKKVRGYYGKITLQRSRTFDENTKVFSPQPPRKAQVSGMMNRGLSAFVKPAVHARACCPRRRPR